MVNDVEAMAQFSSLPFNENAIKKNKFCIEEDFKRL